MSHPTQSAQPSRSSHLSAESPETWRDMTKVLVIGHGPIGHSFIEKMTAEGTDFQISVLCEEPRPAYNRVMLTQYFEDRDAEKRDKMKLSYVSEEELKDQKVKLLYGRAMSIDREAKKVLTLGCL